MKNRPIRLYKLPVNLKLNVWVLLLYFVPNQCEIPVYIIRLFNNKKFTNWMFTPYEINLNGINCHRLNWNTHVRYNKEQDITNFEFMELKACLLFREREAYLNANFISAENDFVKKSLPPPALGNTTTLFKGTLFSHFGGSY